MLVPKKNRLAIYSYLFKEGVLVAKNEFSGKHPQIAVPNLHALKLMQSLKSRGYVKEKFSWQWFYYSLTNEGIIYLREYLHVSGDTVPATLKKATKPQPPPSFGSGRFGKGGKGKCGKGDRDGYRGDKDGGAPRGFNPEFGGRGKGGFGRGRGGKGKGGE